MSLLLKFDDKIKAFVLSKEGEKWAKKIVLGFSVHENPFFSPVANDFCLLPWFDKNRIVELFAKKCLEIEYASTRAPELPKISERKLTFLTDIKPNKFFDSKKPYSIARSVWIGKRFEPMKPPIDLASVLQMKTTSFLELELTRFETKKSLFEPVFFTAFLYDGKDFVTEPWVFVPEPSQALFRAKGIETEACTKANFRLTVIPEKLSLVIILYHPYTYKLGSSVISAYYKGENALKQAEKSIQQVNESEVRSFSTLGFIIAPLEDLLSNVALPAPTICTENITSEYINRVIEEGFVPPKENKLGISMTMHVAAREMDDKTVLSQGTLIGSTQIPVKEPVLNFRHQMLFTVNKASLKMPFWFTEAVYFVISFRNGLNGNLIPLIKDRLSSNKYSSINSISVAASKEAIFNDSFIIDLPLKLEPNATLVFDFYGVATRKEKILREKIGFAFLPLVENGFPISRGVFQLNINEENSGMQPVSRMIRKSSSCQVTMQKRSLVIPESPELAQIYEDFSNNVFDIEHFKKSKDGILMRSSLPLIDILVSKFLENPHDIMEIFIYLSTVGQRTCQKQFDKFLDVFTVHFAFMEESTINPLFHRTLLREWANVINKDIQDNLVANRRDFYLLNFFFVLIIKSIYLTKDRGFSEAFNEFIDGFTHSTSLLNRISHPQALYVLHMFSVFCVSLFDIGLYSTVFEAIETQVSALQDTKEDWIAAMFFLEASLHPKILASALLFSEQSQNLFNNSIYNCIKHPEIDSIKEIFKILNYNIGCMPEDIQAQVCDHLVKSLAYFPVLINNKNQKVTDHLMTTFCFIIGNSSKECFLEFLHKHDDKKGFFAAISALLNYFTFEGKAVDNENRFSLRPFSSERKEETRNVSTGNEEQAFSCQASILHVLENLIDQPQYVDDVIHFFYHLLSENLELSLINPALNLFTRFLECNTKAVFQCTTIAFTKFVIKVFELSTFAKDSSTHFFQSLYRVDKELYGTNNRANCFVQRALSKLAEEVVVTLYLPETPVHELIVKYANVLKESHNIPNTVEKKAESLYNKYMVFENSPDAQIEILDQLVMFNKENEYTLEEVQTRFIQEAIIIEYLSFIGKLRADSFGHVHGAEVFLPFCPAAKDIFMKQEIIDDIPIVPSFCDSSLFRLSSLANHVMKTISICKDYKLHEYAIAMADVIVPFLEQSNDFSLLSISCSQISEAAKLLAAIPPKDDRLLGMYYRVAFYGDIFGSDNEKTFIYRERNLTNIYTFSQRLKQEYEDNNPGKFVEIIKESGTVDPSTLKKGTEYIQITSVDPFLRKKERISRKTQFETKTCIYSFSFDTPFVKGSSKAQGSVEEQWLRRNVFTVSSSMPWILKRHEVKKGDTSVIEYEPCVVSYRMMKSRIEQMKEATALKSYNVLQGLLNGSLLASVNGGPVQIAEAFLKTTGTDVDNSKPRRKLREMFKEFLVVNAAALKVHADYAASRPIYMNLQHELENQLSIITEQLKQFI